MIEKCKSTKFKIFYLYPFYYLMYFCRITDKATYELNNRIFFYKYLKSSGGFEYLKKDLDI